MRARISEQLSKIREITADLLDLSTTSRPPIPIERIARICQAQVRYVPYEGDLSGILYREDGRIIIGVNALDSPVRKRFTIAHELGHLKLHSQTNLYIDRDFRVDVSTLRRNNRSSQAIDSKEIQANTFAAELLMPYHMMIEDLHGQVLDYEDDGLIRPLATRYKVSAQAMLFRLINLGVLTPST